MIETTCNTKHPVHGCACRRPAGHDSHHEAVQGRNDVLWMESDGVLRTTFRQTPSPREVAQILAALQAGR